MNAPNAPFKLAAYKPLIRPATATADRRISFVVEGPPGTGKSTLCGSMAEVVGAERTLLVATLPREAESWKYQTLGVQRVVIEDSNWAPALGKYTADGFTEFRRLVRWLRDEDEQFDAVILDSGTELQEQAWHLSLMPHGVGSPSEMDGKSRWLPYETLANYLDEAIKDLVSLTEVAKRPKHVGVTWHVQPPKDDTVETVGDTKQNKKSADHAAEGVEYEGKVLPMIRGAYRRKLGAQFSAVVYTDMQITDEILPAGVGKVTKKTNVAYRLQVRPDADRHTKLPGPLPPMAYIENSFPKLLETVLGPSTTQKK